MEHHGASHLTYDHQGHDMAMIEQGSEREAEHTISYDQRPPEESGPMMMMMKMYFHFGLGDLLLFEGWVVNSTSKMLLACLVLFLLTILLEAIDYSRGFLSCWCACKPSAGERHASANSQMQLIDNDVGVRNEPNGNQRQQQQRQQQQQQQQRQRQRWPCCEGSQVGQPDGAGEQLHKRRFFPVRSQDPVMVRAAQSCLHFIRTALALGLMLVAMTYNICLIFPILLGSGVGFYIFYRPTSDNRSVLCH